MISAGRCIGDAQKETVIVEMEGDETLDWVLASKMDIHFMNRRQSEVIYI